MPALDWQFAIVVLAALAAAAYVARRLRAQFDHSEDEPEACRGCPATRASARRDDAA